MRGRASRLSRAEFAAGADSSTQETALPLFGIALVFIAVVVIFFVVFRVFSCFVFLIVVFIFDSEIKSPEGNGFHEGLWSDSVHA